MSSLDKNRTVFIKSLDHALHKLDRVHDKASCQQHYSGITKLEGAQFDFFSNLLFPTFITRDV